MPHFPHTPEALLGRNDSKNPATTCKGITSSGRACRRALASPKSSPRAQRKAIGGVVALVQEDGQIQEADFYCWQHKDQAEERAEQDNRQPKGRRVDRRSTELFPLQERSSIDTLVQRLGIDAASDVGVQNSAERPPRKTRNPKPPRRTDTTDFAAQQRPSQAPYAEKYGFTPPAQRQSKPKKPGFWESLCCMSSRDDDYVEIVRHRTRIEQSRPPQMVQSSPLATPTRPSYATVPARRPVNPNLSPQTAPQHQSESNQLLSLIPRDLSPATTSALLSELVKPISSTDEEGYIYIFWLTPQSNATPPESTARSLLAPSRPHNARRISDVMTEFSYDGDNDENDTRTRGLGTESRKNKTIMLKIGRANNVTRRMNEWQRQCGYKLNLVRWYPHISSSSSPAGTPSPHRNRPPTDANSLYPDLSQYARPRLQQTGRKSSDMVRKVRYVKRVERLIHLELAEKQVKRDCTACGKEHREWFEVEASQAGVKAIDEVARRWVGWAEERREE